MYTIQVTMRRTITFFTIFIMLIPTMNLFAQYSINLSNSDLILEKQLNETIFFGYNHAIVGDINNDGLSDIITNDWNTDNTNSNYFIFFGKLGLGEERNASNYDVLIEGDPGFMGGGGGFSKSQFGGNNDINGDGIDDFFIGVEAYNNTTEEYSENQFHIIFGKSGEWDKHTTLLHISNVIIKSHNEKTLLKHSATMINDVNGDGCGDIAFGAGEKFGNGDLDYYGRIFLFFGCKKNWNPIMDLSESDIIINSTSKENPYFGNVLSRAGDLNNDGLDDFVIGGGNTEDTALYFFFGKKNGWKRDMIAKDANKILYYNKSVVLTLSQIVAVGDINGDSLDDLVIILEHFRISIIFGSNNSIFSGESVYFEDYALIIIINEYNAPIFVCDVGDINKDGYNDFLVNLKLNGNNFEIIIFLGRKYGWSEAEISESNENYHYYKIQNIPQKTFVRIPLSSQGDLNGDQKNDILISSGNATDFNIYGFFSLADMIHNSPPQIVNLDNIINQTVYTELSLPVQVADEDNDRIFFELVNHEEDMNISQNGTLQWYPKEIGTFNITVRAFDFWSYSEKVLTINVVPVNHIPVLEMPDKISITQGERFKMDITKKSSDIDGDDLDYRIVQGPSGMNISNDGFLLWRPNEEQIGTFKVILEANDYEYSVNQTIEVTVKEKDHIDEEFYFSITILAIIIIIVIIINSLLMRRNR